MFGDPSKHWSIGLRRSKSFAGRRLPWRFWIGPLLVTGAPSVGWTR